MAQYTVSIMDKKVRLKVKKTSKNKKIKEQISEKTIEKKKNSGESKLEAAVSNVHIDRKEPSLSVEVPEVVFDENVRASARPDLVVNKKNDVDYSIKAGSGDYATGNTIQQLENSSLVSKGGHLGTAESQGVVDQKMGEYNMRSKEFGKYQQSKIYEAPMQESIFEEHTFENVFHNERADKKRKRLGDYV